MGHKYPPVLKCVVVSSATVTKYNRWDAGFYCGEDRSADIALAQKGLEDAQRLLAKRQQEQQESIDRIARMVINKEVVPP